MTKIFTETLCLKVNQYSTNVVGGWNNIIPTYYNGGSSNENVSVVITINNNINFVSTNIKILYSVLAHEDNSYMKLFIHVVEFMRWLSYFYSLTIKYLISWSIFDSVAKRRWPATDSHVTFNLVVSCLSLTLNCNYDLRSLYQPANLSIELSLKAWNDLLPYFSFLLPLRTFR